MFDFFLQAAFDPAFHFYIFCAGAVLFPFMLLGFKILSETESLYQFKPEELRPIFIEVGKMSGSIDDKIDILNKKLMEKYPQKIGKRSDWFLNYAGGILCGITLIYCSNFEYILIWGTPSGNEGVTGRHHFVEFHDTMLDGECDYWSEKHPTATKKFGAGEWWIHKKGDSGGQRIADHGWAVEYARGPLISIMPFGMVSVFWNTLDFVTLFNSLKIYFHFQMKNIF